MKNSQNHCSFTERHVGLGSKDRHAETHQDKVAVEQAPQNLQREHQRGSRTSHKRGNETENTHENQKYKCGNGLAITAIRDILLLQIISVYRSKTYF